MKDAGVGSLQWTSAWPHGHGFRGPFAARRFRWIQLAVRTLLCSPCALAVVAHAQIGPGPQTAPVNVPSGTTTTMVGGTSVTATANTGAVTVAGSLAISPATGSSPGPVAIESVNGTAINVSSGGSLTASSATNVTTTGIGAGLVVSGGTANVTGLTFSNTYTGASSGGHGIIANPGATITLGAGNSIQATANNAMGLAANTGGIITATAPVSITLGGSGGFGNYGIYVRAAGSAVSLLSGSSITLSARQSIGVTADGGTIAPNAISGLTINLDSADTTGAKSTGIMAVNGGSATLDSVIVQGANVGAGAWAVGSSSSVTLTGTSSITLTGTGNTAYNPISIWTAAGLPIFSGAQSGSYAAGLLAQSGTINSTGTTVIVTSGAVGVGVLQNGTVNLVSNTITTTGSGSLGFRLDGGTINAQNSTVNTSGGGSAMHINSGVSTINLTNTTVAATDASTRGLEALNYGASGTNVLTMSGGSLTSGDAITMNATGPLNITLSGGATVSGNQTLIQATNLSSGQGTTVNLDASGNSVLSGNAVAGSTSTLNMSLKTGTRWTGAASNVTNTTLDATSTWNVTGDSTVSQRLSNAGVVGFVAPAAGTFTGRTLTVNNYTGVAGSVIGLHTYLGDDNSPSDKLVINGGTTTGRSALRITNAGGPGAQTTSNGIKVVDTTNGGTTTAGAFVLDGRVVQGAYEYNLFRGSVDSSNPDAWFLRSQASGPPPPDPTPPTPLYRPEPGAYLANQRIAGVLFLHSLHDRLGEPQWTESQLFDDKPDRPAGQAADEDDHRSWWLRLVNKQTDTDSRDGVFNVHTDSWLLHGGGELAQWRMWGEDDRLHMGVMLGYGQGTSDSHAASNPASADGKSTGWSAGVYGTWYQNDNGGSDKHPDDQLGWYADLWGQYGWFKNRVDGEGLPRVSYDSNVLTLSAETGWAKRVQEDSDWILEPQGQLIYVHNSTGSFDEANGTHVDASDGNGWITRLGLRIHRTWVHESGKQTQPYLTFNWWHDSVDNAIAFDDVRLKDLYPANRYEIKLGVNAERGHGWTSWGNLGYQWGQQSYHALSARIGIKHSW